MLGRRSSGVGSNENNYNARTSLGPARIQKNSEAPKRRQSSFNGMRMSTGFGRRSSAYGRPGFSKRTDPRPISDPQYMKECVRYIVRFLNTRGFNEFEVSTKSLYNSPLRAHFLAILQFLYRHIDPQFKFTANIQEEVPMLFRRLRYPYTINKSALQTIGAQHTWPHLLAALNWLVELICVAENTERDGLQNGQTDESSSVFFSYLTKAYDAFLGGQDEFDHLDGDLAASFESKNSALEAEIARMDSETNTIMEEYIALERTMPSPDTLESRKKDYESDVSKFQTLIAQLDTHKAALNRKTLEMKADLAQKNTNLSEAIARKESLEKQVSSQEISAIDVERMMQEKSQLSEIYTGLNSHKETLDKKLWEKDLAYQRIQDTIESKLGTYANLLARTKLADSKMEIEISPENPVETMSNVNIMSEIYPQIEAAHEAARQAFHQAQAEILVGREKYDQADEKRADAEESVSRLELTVRRLQSQYKDDKEASIKMLREVQSKTEDYESQEASLKREGTTIIHDSDRQLALKNQELEELTQLHQNECHDLRAEVSMAVQILRNHKKRCITVLSSATLDVDKAVIEGRSKREAAPCFKPRRNHPGGSKKVFCLTSSLESPQFPPALDPSSLRAATMPLTTDDLF